MADKRPPKPSEDRSGWRWVKVSDDLLDQLREYGEPVRVKVEDAGSDEVIITFQRVEEGT